MTEARVPVTDADVAAAIDLKYALDNAGSTTWSLRAAKPEDHLVAIAFARHRLAGVAAGREEGQAEIGKLRTALIAMGRMLPGVVLNDRVSTDFLCELPAEMGHYHLTAPSEVAAIRQMGGE